MTVSLVDLEISEHRTTIDTILGSVSALSAPKSYTSVIERFQRDCEILKKDLEACTRPTTADFNDFADRRASLQVQMHNLTDQFLVQ